MKINEIGNIRGITDVYDVNMILQYRLLRVAFDDEYNEKRDMTPIRELKIRKDKNGEYVIHNHERYYI